MLDELLEKAANPEQLLCDSLGVSTASITMVDEVTARKIQQTTPHEFHLLEIPPTGQAEGWFCDIVNYLQLMLVLSVLSYILETS